MDLNAFTEQKFWKKNYEAPDLFILNKCNKQSIVASLIFTIVMQIICWHYLAIPIVGTYLIFFLICISGFIFNFRTFLQNPWEKIPPSVLCHLLSGSIFHLQKHPIMKLLLAFRYLYKFFFT